MPLWFEIKKYLLAYRRVLFFFLAAAATLAIATMGVNALLERGSLFEPFTIGVVDNGDSPEIRFVFDVFDDAVTLAYMDKTEAERRLGNGEIPAYVELPDRFAADILTGKNTPFTLHGNRTLPLQWALSRLLATGGVSFLSASQAGIYATLDYAADHGLSWDFINMYVLVPVNVAYVKTLVDYEAIFIPQVIQLTGDRSPAAHYAGTFAVFLWMTGLLSFIPTLRGYTQAVYARWRLTGRSLLRTVWTRLAGLFIVHALLITPLFIVAAGLTGRLGIPEALVCGLALAFAISAFGLMAAALFRNDAACGIFIFVTALAMLFGSGGLVPLAYLPRGLHIMRYVSLPYWAAEGSYTAGGMLLLAGLLCFGVVYIAEFLFTRFSRAV